MLDPQLVEILACPENKSPVRPAEPAVIEQINKAIEAGTLKNRGGQTINEKIDAGLLREDGKWLYPVRDEIPIMLVEEAIALPLSESL